jgi:uncharacterized protein YjiS (DUF1127 family)
MSMSDFKLDPFGAAYRLPRSFANRQTPWLGLIADAASAYVAHIAKAVRARRDIMLLSAMDDGMLSDIGIARSDVERAVLRGRG